MMKRIIFLAVFLSVVSMIASATNIQSHPASQVSASTFGVGNFVFPNNLTVNEYYFGNGRFLTNINESSWDANSSLVAFLINQSSWNVNSSLYCNNSQYLNGNANSYFYPYSNPFNFTNDTTWQYNQTQPAVDYCDATFIILANEGDLNTNSSVYWDGRDSFPTLYEANISDLQSYILGSNEAYLNVNSSTYSNQCYYVNNITERTAFTDTRNITYENYVNANVSATSNNTLFCNGGSCLTVDPTNVSNNTLFFNGRSGNYFWNVTGGIPFTNLTGFDLNEAWINTLGGDNITSGTITSTQLTSNLGLTWGNLSSWSLNNAWTGTLGSGNITINQNLNMSTYNTTRYLPSSSSTICNKDYNGTTLLWCNCFNTTNTWMANIC